MGTSWFLTTTPTMIAKDHEGCPWIWDNHRLWCHKSCLVTTWSETWNVRENSHKKMSWSARTPTFFPPYHCWVNFDKNATSAAKSAQTYSDDLDHWALTFLSFMKLHCSNRTQHDMNISKAKTLTFFVELAAARSGKRSTTAVPTLVWKQIHSNNAPFSKTAIESSQAKVQK